MPGEYIEIFRESLISRDSGCPGSPRGIAFGEGHRPSIQTGIRLLRLLLASLLASLVLGALVEVEVVHVGECATFVTILRLDHSDDFFRVAWDVRSTDAAVSRSCQLMTA